VFRGAGRGVHRGIRSASHSLKRRSGTRIAEHVPREQTTRLDLSVRPSHTSTAARRKSKINSYRRSAWNVAEVQYLSGSRGQAGTGSDVQAHGKATVGLPKSSLVEVVADPAVPCAPQGGCHRVHELAVFRVAAQAATGRTTVARRLPPQMPRPPSHTARHPYHTCGMFIAGDVRVDPAADDPGPTSHRECRRRCPGRLHRSPPRPGDDDRPRTDPDQVAAMARNERPAGPMLRCLIDGWEYAPSRPCHMAEITLPSHEPGPGFCAPRPVSLY